MTAFNLAKSHKILFFNTLAFTICFSSWTLNGTLITFLNDRGIFNFSINEMGWLLGIPILTGSIMRLPLGILTDRYGGKYVYAFLLILCAIPVFLLPLANNFTHFAILSLLFGMVGTAFAVGIAFTSVWYPKEWQGRALGIFGMGNAGAAITTMLTPTLLKHFSETDPINGWKTVPIIYGIALLIMGIIFLIFTENKKPESAPRNIKAITNTLKDIRVWRFGLYYLLVFGFFVAYSQWLVPNFVNVYGTSLVLAGLFASAFSLPSGVIRALGGFLSDKFGARNVMYWVLGSSVLISFLLIFPKMEVFTAGKGLVATKDGTITGVSPTEVRLNKVSLAVKEKNISNNKEEKTHFFPYKNSWQEVVVKENQVVKKKEILAKGITQINFDANMWVYLTLVVLIGISWGIGKAAVYKHIPEYFPAKVGLVGGLVGVLGGLGGFIGPIFFGYLLTETGMWTSSWILIFIVSIICLIWMHRVITKMMNEKSPNVAKDLDKK